MGCTVEEREFVHRHVAEFSKRHRAKIGQITPAIDVREVIRNSGDTSLITAKEKVDAMSAEITALLDKMNAAVAQFNLDHKDIVHGLVNAVQTERTANIKKQQEDFEYKLRTAIGLVELVGAKEAYDVLESCRSQIEAM